MVSVKNEINDILLNIINDLEKRLDESRNLLADIQSKMDSKVSEAKEYKVSVDDAKDNIRRLEEEIKSLENDLDELKEKYGKKNLVAVIEAGTKEISHEIKKKQDEIQLHKNKIADLTNRARSIKDLLLNFKKDKKIKEEKLEELENCTKYYKKRLEEVIEFSENHDDLMEYFSVSERSNITEASNVFEDIVGFDDSDDNFSEEIEVDHNIFDEVSISDVDDVFNDVINPVDEIDSNIESVSLDETDEDNSDFNFEDIAQSLENNTVLLDNDNVVEDNEEEKVSEEFDDNSNSLEEEQDVKKVVDETEELLSINDNLENTSDLKINDLINSVKEPVEEIEKEDSKISNINKAIDEEFANIFGKSINEPVKTVDIFGNEFVENEVENNEADIVNKLSKIGLDYYSFTEADRTSIIDNFNEQIIADIVNVLKENKIQLDNIYIDGTILSKIAPSELSNIITKLLNAGQSADSIGYVLDKLPLVDAKLIDVTINNYGDYIKNVDITDIILKSLKGAN